MYRTDEHLQMADLEAIYFEDAYSYFLEHYFKVGKEALSKADSMESISRTLNIYANDYGFKVDYNGTDNSMDLYYPACYVFTYKELNLSMNHKEIFYMADKIIRPAFLIKISFVGTDIKRIKSAINSNLYKLKDSEIFTYFRNRLFEYLEKNDDTENSILIDSYNFFIGYIDNGDITYNEINDKITRDVFGEYPCGIYHKTCPVCGNKFDTMTYSQKYCSDECKKQKIKKTNIDCQYVANSISKLCCIDFEKFYKKILKLDFKNETTIAGIGERIKEVADDYSIQVLYDDKSIEVVDIFHFFFVFKNTNKSDFDKTHIIDERVCRNTEEIICPYISRELIFENNDIELIKKYLINMFKDLLECHKQGAVYKEVMEYLQSNIDNEKDILICTLPSYKNCEFKIPYGDVYNNKYENFQYKAVDYKECKVDDDFLKIIKKKVEPFERICPTCGKSFSTGRADKIYCCKKCRDKDYRRKYKK